MAPYKIYKIIYIDTHTHTKQHCFGDTHQSDVISYGILKNTVHPAKKKKYKPKKQVQ
jgi:hypothetical protein